MSLDEPNGSLASLLARIDERTIATSNAVLEIKSKMETHYVTQNEFRPVKSIVYGLVGLILTSVVIALIAMVVVRGGH